MLTKSFIESLSYNVVSLVGSEAFLNAPTSKKLSDVQKKMTELSSQIVVENNKFEGSYNFATHSLRLQTINDPIFVEIAKESLLKTSELILSEGAEEGVEYDFESDLRENGLSDLVTCFKNHFQKKVDIEVKSLLLKDPLMKTLSDVRWVDVAKPFVDVILSDEKFRKQVSLD